MKLYLYFLSLTFCLVLFSSCVAYSDFIITGEPGTHIKTPDGKDIGYIDDTKQLKYTFSRADYYTPFLLSKSPNSNKYIPFALDYKETSGITIPQLIGSTAAMIGLIVGGPVTLINESAAGAVVLFGLGGGGAAYLAQYTLSRTDITQCYKYIPTQYTNNDLFQGTKNNK